MKEFGNCFHKKSLEDNPEFRETSHPNRPDIKGYIGMSKQWAEYFSISNFNVEQCFRDILSQRQRPALRYMGSYMLYEPKKRTRRFIFLSH
ncbi:hypothetical protein CSB09_04560 [Candidatus Gracilibacteria bacterium]|nr:MAG: hypothetical protein CSB09_04560 [Candidatus Gracilibacteria bacterium]